jgi:hypothetical protein
VYGDNQSAVHNLEIGSKTPEQQAVCVKIFMLCVRHGIKLLPRWLGRRYLQEEDDVSKFVDSCNFTLDADALRALDTLGAATGCTHDRFATCENR